MRSYLALIFRATGLQIVNNRVVLRQEEERPKIAIQKHRLAALLRASVHLLPVAGCIYLCVLNSRPWAVLPKYPWEALQFVAKAHEILMQASISTIAVAYIRRELVSGQWMPLGALFSALQIDRLSYLWSMELWATLTASCLQSHRKALFVFFIPAGILLAAAVGPSSAMAMIPRAIVYPYFKAELWWNATQQKYIPKSYNRGRRLSMVLKRLFSS
jgi:hypothetical protein